MSHQPQKSGVPISNTIQYIVILKSEQGTCCLIPEQEPFEAVYHKVYSPASEEKCREWMAENCRELA